MAGHRIILLLNAVWFCVALADHIVLESGEIYFPDLLELDSEYNVLDNSFVREKLAGKVKPPKADPRPPSEEPLPRPAVLKHNHPIIYQTDKYLSKPMSYRYPEDYIETPGFKEHIVYRPLFSSESFLPTQYLPEYPTLERPIDKKPVNYPKPENKPDYVPYPPYRLPETTPYPRIESKPSYPPKIEPKPLYLPKTEPKPVYLVEEKPAYIPKPGSKPTYVPKSEIYDVTTYRPYNDYRPTPLKYPNDYHQTPKSYTQRPPELYYNPDEVQLNDVRIGGDRYKPKHGAKLTDGHNMYIPEKYDEDDFSGIPGRPGKNYPVFSYPPQTDFYCSDHQYPGYYADTEAYCQVFHICQADGRANAFLCPNGTLFNQQYFVCDWWYNVNCANAISFYSLNAYLYRDVYTTSYRRPYSN